jgi:hypothetical protein
VPKQTVLSRAHRLQEQHSLRFPLEEYAHTYAMDPIPQEDVPVLTDDYAPVDGLLHFSIW